MKLEQLSSSQAWDFYLLVMFEAYLIFLKYLKIILSSVMNQLMFSIQAKQEYYFLFLYTSVVFIYIIFFKHGDNF